MKDKVYSQVYSILKTSKEGVLEAIEGLAKIGFDGIEAMGTNTGGQWRKPKIRVYAFSFALRSAANRRNVV